jgi:hypothetical protein
MSVSSYSGEPGLWLGTTCTRLLLAQNHVGVLGTRPNVAATTSVPYVIRPRTTKVELGIGERVSAFTNP